MRKHSTGTASTGCGDAAHIGGEHPTKKSVTTIFGMLTRARERPRTIEELADAAAAGWAGEREEDNQHEAPATDRRTK